MYSSIYRVQSSTRRLPIRALFGFTLKQVESYPFPFPSELHVWWLVLGSPWVTSVDTYQHVEEHHWLCFVSWMRIGCCHLHVGGWKCAQFDDYTCLHTRLWSDKELGVQWATQKRLVLSPEGIVLQCHRLCCQLFHYGGFTISSSPSKVTHWQWHFKHT